MQHGWMPWRERIQQVGLSAHASRQWGLIGLWLWVGGVLGLWFLMDWLMPPPVAPKLWTELVWGRLVVGGVLWLGALVVYWFGKTLPWLVWVEWLGWLCLSLYLGFAWAWIPSAYAFAVPCLMALLLVARGICIPGGPRSYGPVVLVLWGMADLFWYLLAPKMGGAVWRGFWFAQWALLLGAGLGAWAAWRVDLLWCALTQANRLDRYRVVKRMQTHGMSRIEVGWHELLERPCILKRLPGSAFPLESEVQEFRREAELVIWIQNPHVVRVFDFGETKEDFYLAMEYLLGVDLHTLLKAQGPLPQRRVVHLMRQICDGMAAVHEQGILHRDIKPSNMFLTFDRGQYDFIKVIDFGIARRRPSLRPPGVGRERVPGTPAFMAPERFAGEGDLPSEIYALGILLYTMLMGQPPFRASSVEQYKLMHTSTEPSLAPLRAHRPDLLPQLADVILRAIAKNPGQRFSSVESMKMALDQCQHRLGVWQQEEAAQAWHHLISQGLVDATSITSLFPEMPMSTIQSLQRMTALPGGAAVHSNTASSSASYAPLSEDHGLSESADVGVAPSLVLPDWDELRMDIESGKPGA